MGVNVCEPAVHGEESQGSRSTRWAWLAGFAVAAIALFLCYLRFAGTYPTDTDGSDQALQAWDMLHGNLLLHGWTIADVTYYTTEIPQYMLIELVRGLGPEVEHIAGASTYTLLVLAAGLLARGRATGRDGLIRLLVAAGIMLAPQFGNATHLLLSQPDHLGTQLPLLLVFLLLDRAPRRWYVPVAAGWCSPGSSSPTGWRCSTRSCRSSWSAAPASCWPSSATASPWPPSGTSCPWSRRVSCRSSRPRSPCG